MLAQFLGQGSGRLFTFLTVVLLTRELGPSNYGTLSFFLALIGLFGQPLFSDGVDSIVTKQAVLGKNLVLPAFALKLLGLSFATLLFLGLSAGKGYPFSELLILLLYTFSMSAQSLIGGFLRGLGKISVDAVLSTAFKGAILVSVVFASILPIHRSLSSYEDALLVGGTLGLLPCIVLTARELLAEKELSMILLKDLFLETYPLTLAGFFWILYFKINQAMLGFMGTPQGLGYFAAAYKIMEASFFLPAVFMSVSFPKLTAQFVENKTLFEKKFRDYALLLLMAGVTIATIAWGASYWIISLTYGKSFLPSVPIFRILLFAIPFVYIGTLLTQTFIILGQQKIFMWLTLLMAVVNLGLNYIAIPRWGTNGAGWATVITEAAMTSLALLFLRKIIRAQSSA